MLTTTTFELPGHRVVRCIGVVRGITVRTRSMPELRANAVVGVRYDTGPMVGAAEVLCYGTAVVVE